MKRLPHNFNPEIMRMYDIRGIFNETLSVEDPYYISKCLIKIIDDNNLPKLVCIARDGRISSPTLYSSLLKGLMDSGATIIDVGIVATPMLYYTSFEHNATLGIMITGSHNPKDHNGLKIVYCNKPFFAEKIQELMKIAAIGDYVYGEGILKQIDIKHQYVTNLINKTNLKTSANFKVAWDSGNGATGEVVEMLTSNINCEHFLINTEIDGNFPNHHPDPTVAANMEQLKQLVLLNQCDIGFAFDGDGDRLGAVDSMGRIIGSDQLLLILSYDLLTRNPGAKIIVDVKISDLILNEIISYGGQPILCQTGHSFIKIKMLEEFALLAGEMSGHLFFAENYYGFDDALFAACKMIDIISNSDESLAQMIDKSPKIYTLPEFKIKVLDKDKFKLIGDLKIYLEKNSIAFSDLDGLKVRSDLGWWLIRASNTQSYLIINIEGNSEDALFTLTNNVIKILSNINLDISLILENYA